MTKDLPTCWARAGDHQDVVLGLDHREVQAGAQAAHGLGGEVGRVVDGQQVGCSALVALEVGQALLQRGLLLGEGNRGVDRSAGAFDVLRVLHAALECFTHIDEGGGEQGAEQGGDDDDQRLVRLYRVFQVCRGVVDDAHVTHGAGADDVQLLGLVQQHGVGFEETSTSRVRRSSSCWVDGRVSICFSSWSFCICSWLIWFISAWKFGC